MSKRFLKAAVPTWYELSFLQPSRLFLSIHRLAFNSLCEVDWQEAPAVPDLIGRFKIPGFVAPNDGDWGFGSVLKRVDPKRDGFLAWEFELPVMKRKTALPGEHQPSEHSLMLRSTLHLVFNFLSIFNQPTSADDSQLLVVDGLCLPNKEREFAAGSVSIDLLPPVIAWLAKIKKDYINLDPVREALILASDHMWQTGFDEFTFKVTCRDSKWLNFNVPGNGSSLDPDNYRGTSLEHGYELHSHNIDSGLQQFMLLAGVARLHDLVRANAEI